MPRCPTCKQSVGTTTVRDKYYRWAKIIVTALHFGKNGKPCSGVGTRPLN